MTCKFQVAFGNAGLCIPKLVHGCEGGSMLPCWLGCSAVLSVMTFLVTIDLSWQQLLQSKAALVTQSQVCVVLSYDHQVLTIREQS